MSQSVVTRVQCDRCGTVMVESDEEIEATDSALWIQVSVDGEIPDKFAGTFVDLCEKCSGVVSNYLALIFKIKIKKDPEETAEDPEETAGDPETETETETDPKPTDALRLLGEGE